MRLWNKKIIQSYSVVQLVIQRSWLMQSMKYCQKIISETKKQEDFSVWNGWVWWK